jgi:REP element-mobilizing transposase RayT
MESPSPRSVHSVQVQTPIPSGPPGLLPRLHPSAYQADAAILWTHPTYNRATGWLTPNLHHEFRELALHLCAREKLLIPVYVLMPDHIHMVVLGLDKNSDQRNGMAFLRRYLEPKLHPARLQPQAHDRVLRAEDRKRNAFAAICQYVIQNPVRAKFSSSPTEYPYLNSIIPGYPDLNPTTVDFWPKFWKIQSTNRNQNCNQHVIVAGFAP